MNDETMSQAKRRLLHLLKRTGPSTAGALAEELGLTGVAIRQHLQELEKHGLVAQRKQPAEGRGRPSMLWSLTDLAEDLFPDRHGELTVALIEALRRSFGTEGVDRVIAVRAKEQVKAYRAELPHPSASLKARVQALAQRRTAEGYMAEVVQEKPGCYLLIEHHCPICEAARSCTGLCGAELEVFRQSLGEGISVERTAHLLSGDDRCVYRIRRA